MIINAEIKDIQQEDADKRIEYIGQKKSLGVAILLWFFVGLAGAHNFYTNKTGQGLLKIGLLLLSWLVVPGIILILLMIVDLFYLSNEVDIFNEKLRQRLGLYGVSNKRDDVF